MATSISAKELSAQSSEGPPEPTPLPSPEWITKLRANAPWMEIVRTGKEWLASGANVEILTRPDGHRFRVLTYTGDYFVGASGNVLVDAIERLKTQLRIRHDYLRGQYHQPKSNIAVEIEDITISMGTLIRLLRALDPKGKTTP